MPPRLLLLLALLARRAAAQAAYSEAVLAPRLLANIDALMQEPLAPVQLSLEASAMEFLDLSSDVAVRQWLYQQVLAAHTGDVAWAEAAHGGSPTMSMLYVVRATRPPASSRPPSSPRRPACSATCCASCAARVRLPRFRFSSMTATMRRGSRTAASSATSPRRP